MTSLDSFRLDSLNHDEVHNFLSEMSLQLEETLPQNDDEATEFLAKVKDFETVWQETKDDTLIAADAAADMAWLDFNAFLNGMINYPDNNIAGAVAEVKATFDEFDDPTELPYKEEYRIMDLLIAKLDALPLNVRRDSLAQPLIDQLKQRCDEFNKLYRERSEAGTEGGFIRAKEAMTNISKEYAEFVEKCREKMYGSQNESEYENFAVSLNDIINRPQSGGRPRRRMY